MKPAGVRVTRLAFGLPAGQVSEPVRSPFGVHLIEVTEIRESDQPSLDAVRDQVVQALQRAEAEKRYYDQVERLSDLTYENAGSLDPAAEALGLEPRVTDWFGREGGLGVLASPKVVAAAFSEEVRGEGDEIGHVHRAVVRHLGVAVEPVDVDRQEVLPRASGG